MSNNNTPIEVVQVPRNLYELLNFNSFLPDFAYRVDGYVESINERERKVNFEQFLQENYELILNQMMSCGISVENKDIYLRGFRDALAITELWISSPHISGKVLEDINK
jgi:hypothetical protein